MNKDLNNLCLTGVLVPVTSMIPCMAMPLHQAPMPMYAGPSMVPVYPYPHGMVYSPYMVPVTLSSNGMVPSSYIPVTMTTMPATLSSNRMVSASYIPVTMTTGPNPIYASQPLMMPPQVDGHIPQRPHGVTMNCCPPSMVGPRVMQSQVMPVPAAMTAGQPGFPQLLAPAVGNADAGNLTAEVERRNRKVRPANYYENQADEPCRNDEETKEAGDGVAKLWLRKDSDETGYVNRNEGTVQDIEQQAGDAVATQLNVEAVQLQMENAASEAFTGGDVVKSNHVVVSPDVKVSSENSWVSTRAVGSRKSSTASDVPAHAAVSRKSSTASDTQVPGNGGSSNASTRRSSVASETSLPVSTNGSQGGNASANCGSTGSATVSKPRSWASLLHNTATATNAIVINANDQTQQVNDTKKTADPRTPTGVKDKTPYSVDARSMAPLDEVKVELMSKNIDFSVLC